MTTAYSTRDSNDQCHRDLVCSIDNCLNFEVDNDCCVREEDIYYKFSAKKQI